MNRYVLDASAVLAVIGREPGADTVTAVLAESVVSTVNLAEVHGKLAERGHTRHDALDEILSVIDRIVPFTEKQASLTGKLRSTTAHLGLSLGDRACLALAIDLDAEVYTTDKAWKKLTLPCSIRIIR